MGEIKSTLEIIMEKTNGLTVSDEEKEAFQRKEVEGKVRGLLRRFLDGRLDLEGLGREIADIGKERHGRQAKVFLSRECLNHIDPRRDNAPLLDVLRKLAQVEIQPLVNLLSEFRQDFESQKAIFERGFRERLAERGITGTAIIPNINAEPDWLRHLSQMKEAFQERLTSIKVGLDD